MIDGKPYKTFLDQQSKIMKTWILPVDGEMCRVVLEKDTLDIWVNGKKVEVAAEFTDDGKVIPCPFHCGLIIFRILPFPFYSSQNVLCQLGLDRTGHMTFLTGLDRTPKFAGQVLTESELIFLIIFPTNCRLLLLIR